MVGVGAVAVIAPAAGLIDAGLVTVETVAAGLIGAGLRVTGLDVVELILLVPVGRGILDGALLIDARLEEINRRFGGDTERRGGRERARPQDAGHGQERAIDRTRTPGEVRQLRTAPRCQATLSADAASRTERARSADTNVAVGVGVTAWATPAMIRSAKLPVAAGIGPISCR